MKRPYHKYFQFFLLFIFLPALLTKFFSPHSSKFLLFFYLVELTVVFFFARKIIIKKYGFDLRLQNLQEQMNLLQVSYSANLRNNAALIEKLERYNSLRELLEELNSSFDLELLSEILTLRSFRLIGKNQGVCILYLTDQQNQKLILFKTKKEDPRLIIKAKEGDVLDYWVVKHGSPLLIEDLKNDFRFDTEKIVFFDSRPLLSLISAPFLSDNKLLGILRLDSKTAGTYSQDDLRFLTAISDLGSVAIENSELYKSTQDLAIHDSLTKFYTKSFFLDTLKEECRKNVKDAAHLSLLMIDIDLFKNYNDQFGHTAGDLVLKHLSKILVNSLLPYNSVISRFGGEEFGVLMLGVSKDRAFDFAQELRKEIESERIILRRVPTGVTVSIGVASFGQDVADHEEFIRRADKAMYEAKQKGRNAVCSI